MMSVGHVLDHVLDYMIIGFVTTALQFGCPAIIFLFSHLIISCFLIYIKFFFFLLFFFSFCHSFINAVFFHDHALLKPVTLSCNKLLQFSYIPASFVL